MAESNTLATKTYSTEDNRSARTLAYREGCFNDQSRRHEDWRETYSLYRDRVFTNRLTQRQSVNVPLMKETIRTMLSKTDEFTDIYFENLSGDKQKEIYINAYWDYFYHIDNLELKDIVDKKQVGLYGRSIMKLNLFDGRPTVEVLEPYDWLCDRYADPADISNTANYQAHINIFQTISEIEANPLYDHAVVMQLREKYAQALGLALSDENVKALQAKNERLTDLGLFDVNNPQVGETYVEINEHYIRLMDDETKKLEIFLRITADGLLLFEKKLKDYLNIDFYPFITWADDIEKTDIWSDGLGDITRTPNKVLNSWYSQMVENRTLRNFGMHFYDATQGDGKWIPQSYDPAPWGFYPVAGNPNDVIKQVDIPDLSESMDEMNFIIGMVERATATTATEKGVDQKGDITLGQVKLMLANSNQRITSTAKFYRLARVELGEKWYKFVMANEKWIKATDLFKKSTSGKMFQETVKPSDWKDEVGYVCKVVSSSEREQKTIESIQKLQAVSGMFPENVPLKKILQKKAIDMLDLSPEEQKEVMDFEPVAPMPTDAGGAPLPKVTPPVAPAMA